MSIFPPNLSSSNTSAYSYATGRPLTGSRRILSVDPLAPGNTNLAAVTPVKRSTIPYYTLTEAQSVHNYKVIAQLSKYPSTYQLAPRSAGCWISTLFEAMFPGSLKAIFTANRSNNQSPQTLTLLEMPMPRWFLSYLSVGQMKYGQLDTNDVQLLNNHNDNNMHFQANVTNDDQLSDDQIRYLIDTQSLFPSYTHNADIANIVTRDGALVHLTTLIFAIGKAPTAQNISAFQSNRPRAILSKGMAQIEDHPLANIANMPTLKDYQTVNGFFNQYSEYRVLFTSEIIKWSYMAGNPDMELFSSQIRLWANSGYTHVMLVRKFLISYADIAIQLPSLVPEIEQFLYQYQQLSQSSDFLRPYYRVIYMDKYNDIVSKNYTELLKLSRDIASLQDTRYKNYAATLAQSGLMTAFTNILTAQGQTLPEVVAQNTANVQQAQTQQTNAQPVQTNQ